MNKIINDDFRNHLDKFTQDAFIFSDPPYNQKYHYSNYKDNLDIDEYGTLLLDAFSEHKSIIILYPEPTINILGKLLDNCQETVSWIYNSNTAKQHRLITWWNCKPDFRQGGGNHIKIQQIRE